jgi:hypothetical protein
LEPDVERPDDEYSDQGGEDHAAEHGRDDIAPRQLRGAGRHDKRQQAKDESERSHHHRPEALTRTLGRGLEQRRSMTTP